MRYLLFYLAAGVVTLIIVKVQDYRDTKKKGPSLSDSLAELKLQQAPAWKRSVEKVVVPLLAGILVIIAWPIAMVMAVKLSIANKGQENDYSETEFTITKEDLLERLTIEQIEAREMVNDPLGAVPDKPFGHLWPTWQKFKQGLRPKDELYAFSATRESPWGDVETRTGYAVRRRSKIGPMFTAARAAAIRDTQ